MLFVISDYFKNADKQSKISNALEHECKLDLELIKDLAKSHFGIPKEEYVFKYSDTKPDLPVSMYKNHFRDNLELRAMETFLANTDLFNKRLVEKVSYTYYAIKKFKHQYKQPRNDPGYRIPSTKGLKGQLDNIKVNLELILKEIEK